MGKHEGRKLAVGALVAGAAGFVAGLLTAPKSGKETREDIKQATTSAVRAVEKQLKVAHTEIQELVVKVREEAETRGKGAKKEAEELLKRGAEAQKRVKEILTAIHDGTADDPELQAAMKEAAAAKKHLQKFLTKKK
jgi:gas vesicle protein